MTPLLLVVLLGAGAPQHPVPPAKPPATEHVKVEKPDAKAGAEKAGAHETPKPETGKGEAPKGEVAKADAKTEAAKPAVARKAAAPTDAAARILERLDQEFPLKDPKAETPGRSQTSKGEARVAPRAGAADHRGSGRVTLSWRITLTWPAMR